MKNLRHFELRYISGESLVREHGKQLAKILPKMTNLSTFNILNHKSLPIIDLIKSIINGFKNDDQPVRLKPLMIRIDSDKLFLDQVLDLEDMLHQHPNLISKLLLSFDLVKLKRADGTNVVEEMMKNTNRMIAHPLMHEYFSTK